MIHDKVTTTKPSKLVTGCFLIFVHLDFLVFLTAQCVNRALPAQQIPLQPSPPPRCWEEVWVNWTICYRSWTPPSSTSQVSVCFHISVLFNWGGSFLTLPLSSDEILAQFPSSKKDDRDKIKDKATTSSSRYQIHSVYSYLKNQHSSLQF